MHMPFDKKEFCPGGMKYRVALDRMMVGRTVGMPGVVFMAVTVIPVTASTQVAVSIPPMMVLKRQTVIEMGLAMAVCMSLPVSFRVIVLVRMVVIAVILQVVVVVIESIVWPDQLLLHCCQSRTEHSILFQQFFERCGGHPRIRSSQKQRDASDKKPCHECVSWISDGVDGLNGAGTHIYDF